MKTEEVIKILEDNKITNVVKHKPKIIHTKKFSCADDHPIVWYIFDENNKAMCEYCSTHFVYEPKDFYDKAQEEKELLGMGLKDSIRQKEEREKKKFVNEILKGSG
jgi:uncharacterized Zn-finger protein|tara:strand:- start:330 stop:647 length:318 start_codon:yes stop_codon:yes gene_type:complete